MQIRNYSPRSIHAFGSLMLITEHQFGTLKRQRGFTHTNVRGKENVPGEVGIVFIGYNMRRCVSILGIEGLIKALMKSCLSVLSLKIRFNLSL